MRSNFRGLLSVIESAFSRREWLPGRRNVHIDFALNDAPLQVRPSKRVAEKLADIAFDDRIWPRDPSIFDQPE